MLFQPGNNANPLGLKKTQEQKEFEAKCRKLAIEIGIPFISKMALEGTKTDKKWAIDTALDRGFGKAAQVNYNENSTTPDISDEVLKLQMEELELRLSKLKDDKTGISIPVVKPEANPGISPSA